MMTTLKAATAAVSVLALCAALPTFAQAAKESKDSTVTDSQVVVVTANKRKEKLFDVPQAVNVVGADDVKKLNLTQFDDVQKVVPGLNVTRGQGNQFSVSLRGVFFDPNSSPSPTVDLYLNEVPVDASTVLGATYDLGDFQILRGPQGTLRSGTGPSGAILQSTKQANLGGFDGYMQVSGSSQDNENGQFGFSLPVIQDKLAIRVAGLYDHNTGVGGHGVYYDDPDHGQTESGRVSLTFKPFESLSMHAMYQSTDSRITNSTIIAGTGPWGTFVPQDRTTLTKAPQLQTLASNIFTFDAAWDIAGNRLSYVGGVQKNTSGTIRDTDLENSFGGFGAGIEQYQRIITPTTSQSNELRFERTGDHFWTYRFGASFVRDATNSDILIDYTAANGSCLTKPGFLAAYGLPCIQLGGTPTVSKSLGLFTTQDFKFSPNDIVEVGLRASDFKNSSGDYKSTTGSANYKHYFSKSLMAYINYGTSYRPGFTDTSSMALYYMVPASLFTTKPEKSQSFELGFRDDLFDHRLELSGDVFHQKFNNYLYRAEGVDCTAVPNSNSGPNAATNYPTNDGKPYNGTNGCTGGDGQALYVSANANAIAQGVELEARGRILPGWTAQVNGVYNDSHFDNATILCNDFNGDGVPDSAGTPGVQRGKYVSTCKSDGPIANLPKWTLTLQSNYNFDLPHNWQGFIRGLATIKPSSTDPFLSYVTPKSETVDVFFGANQLSRQLEVTIYVKNLLDQVIVNQFGSGVNYGQYYITNGRRVGVQLRKSF